MNKRKGCRNISAPRPRFRTHAGFRARSWSAVSEQPESVKRGANEDIEMQFQNVLSSPIKRRLTAAKPVHCSTTDFLNAIFPTVEVSMIIDVSKTNTKVIHARALWRSLCNSRPNCCRNDPGALPHGLAGQFKIHSAWTSLPMSSGPAGWKAFLNLKVNQSSLTDCRRRARACPGQQNGSTSGHHAWQSKRPPRFVNTPEPCWYCAC